MCGISQRNEKARGVAPRLGTFGLERSVIDMAEIIKKVFGKVVKITCPSMTSDGKCKLESTLGGYPPCVAPRCIYGKIEVLTDEESDSNG